MFLCCAQADETATVIEEVKISAVLPKEPEKPATKNPEFGVFTVVVPTGEFSTLGLSFCLLTDVHMISEVKQGSGISKFNELNPDQSLRVYDQLIAVDDVEDKEGIDAKLDGKLPDKMALKLHRPRKLQVAFKKTGSLGVKLDFTATSTGAQIKEVAPAGHIPTWNAANLEDAVKALDRLVEFNGQKKLGDELLDAITKESSENTMTLTVLKY